ncbi:MAG: acyl-CoA dehydrogenase family protein [Planctomycetota bacterium]
MIDPIPFLTEHDEAFAASVRSWINEELVPKFPDPEAHDADTALRLLKSLGEGGFLRSALPSLDGRMNSVRLCLLREALAQVSPLADTLSVMQGLGGHAIARHAQPGVRADLVPRFIDGSACAAFALTETGAGSDVNAITTAAVKRGASYELNGAKTLISNAGIATHYTVFARTGAGREGLTAFLVPAHSNGLSVTPQELLAPHPIGELELRGVMVPEQHRLGAEGQGFGVALTSLDVFRPTVGAAACGLARRALDESLKRSREREQFGRAILDFQATRMMIADMVTELSAARLLVYRAAWVADHQGPSTRLASMAKLFATEVAQRIVDRAVQLCGGAGLVKGHIAERLYREVRALRIYEGTSEIQRLIIADRLLQGR